MQVGSLGREDPLEEEMAAHSNILACKNLMDRGIWRLQSVGYKESDMTQWLSIHHDYAVIFVYIFLNFYKKEKNEWDDVKEKIE